MTRVAILVIAATDQPVYRHYIASYWTDVIRHTREHVPDIDVFLLNEHGADPRPFRHIAAHVIEDPIGEFDHLVPPEHGAAGIPSVLSKTIHALDLLGDDYDLFFRTNLSSMVMVSAFDRFVRSRQQLGYAGGWAWTDALREHLVATEYVGPGRRVEQLSELDAYPGDTFVSGSGFFLGAEEARHLVDRRDDLRWDLPDDVAIGLMLAQHELLPGFAERITSDTPIAQMLDRIERTDATHIRLEHFPVERARALWRYLAASDAWR